MEKTEPGGQLDKHLTQMFLMEVEQRLPLHPESDLMGEKG